MTLSLLGELPPELLLRITNELAPGDRCSFSATNSQFRKFLTPTLFEVVKINSDKCQGKALSDFCRKFGGYTKKLKFECCLHPKSDEDDSDDENGEDNAAKSSSDARPADETMGVSEGQQPESNPAGLPQHLQDLLSGKMLPKMTALEVLFLPENNFGYDEDWVPGQDLGSIYIHEDDEDADTILSREHDYAWRFILNQVFTGMARNQSIRRLELLDLLPKACSFFQDSIWTSFLGGLDEIKIELWGGDNGAGWHSNTMPGYLFFVAELNRIFFEHLTSLKRLQFIADSQNTVGCEGMRHSPVPFRPGQMAALEELDLWNCYIDPPLLEFLKAKSGQLRKIRLLECFSAGEDFGLAENGLLWSKFFRAWREAKPVCEELVVFNSTVPLTADEQFKTRESKEEEPDEVKAVRDTLKRDTHRKLFSYGYLDDKYGMVFCNEEANMEQFEQGDDQKEYDALLEVVAKTRKRQHLTAICPEPTSEYIDSMMRRQQIRQDRYNG